jgi:hypothetical protein
MSTPELLALAETLLRTTGQMAASCSVPMDLWQAHSTATLQAAEYIRDHAQPMSQSLPSREVVAREIRRAMLDNPTDDSFNKRAEKREAIANDTADAILARFATQCAPQPSGEPTPRRTLSETIADHLDEAENPNLCAPQPGGEPVAWRYQFNDERPVFSLEKENWANADPRWTEAALYANPASAEIIERCAKLREALSKGFMTAVSGDDEYQIKIGFETLRGMQQAHLAICRTAMAPIPDERNTTASGGAIMIESTSFNEVSCEKPGEGCEWPECQCSRKEPRGTFACPVCGEATPHHHAEVERREECSGCMNPACEDCFDLDALAALAAEGGS